MDRELKRLVYCSYAALAFALVALGFAIGHAIYA